MPHALIVLILGIIAAVTGIGLFIHLLQIPEGA
jgi:hypothetical protein